MGALFDHESENQPYDDQALTRVHDDPTASGFAPGARSIMLSSGHASSSLMTRRGVSILIWTRFSIEFSTTR